jgi:hypothetical protein
MAAAPATPLKAGMPPPLSPILRIVDRLPAMKRAPLLSASPEAKRPRTELRRSVLVRRVEQLQAGLPGLTVTGGGVGLGEEEEMDKEDEPSIIVINDDSTEENSQDPEENGEDRIANGKDESVELEEKEFSCSVKVVVETSSGISSENTIAETEEKEKEGLLEVPKPKASAPKAKKKAVEIKWKSVKRMKRKTKIFTFCETFGGPVEVEAWGAERSSMVPAVLSGRRPWLVVPGIDYGLGEGHGVQLTEEEEREVRLANKENYAIDSFVCDAGYLSEEEMVETPGVDRAARRAKQRRGARGVKVGPVSGSPDTTLLCSTRCRGHPIQSPVNHPSITCVNHPCQSPVSITCVNHLRQSHVSVTQ